MLQLPRRLPLIRHLRSSVSVFRFPFQHSFSTTDSLDAAAATATTSTQQKKKGSDLLVDYLVNSIGLSRDEAISASSQVSTSRLKSTHKADLVVNLFKQYGGLDQTHIRQLVSSAPKVFSYKSLKTLESKIRAFQDIGLSGSDLVGLIRRYPHILNRGLSSAVPNISYVRRLLGGSDDQVVKVIKASSWLLSSSSNCTLNYVQPNVVWLRRNNLLSNEQIERLVISYPKVLLQRPESLLEAVRRIEGHWGIPRDSKMFFYGIIGLGAISEESVENKLNVFRSFGWSDTDIHAMLRNLPTSMLVNETTIEQKLNFYMTELGYTPAYLVVHPALLSYSLEKRVKPRNEVLKTLKEHELVKSSQTLYSFVKLTEEKFMKVFVLPYKANLPMLYEMYTKNKKQQLKA